MAPSWVVGVLVMFLLAIRLVLAKDLYNVLGVERNASQRDIQKAFHRLSLKYHPDKNKAKDAQARFAEINNAYEILSDEEKRKNYDLFGDEQGHGKGSEPGGHTDSQGWSHFTSNSNGNQGYAFQQHMEGFQNGGGGTFKFPFTSGFGGQGRTLQFDFGEDLAFGDMVKNFFSSGGSHESRQFFTGGSWNQWRNNRFQGGKSSQSAIAEHLSSRDFKWKVLNQYLTWAVLFYDSSSPKLPEKIAILEQIANLLHGSIKVGLVDCQSQQSLCREQKSWPLRHAKLCLYSLRNNGRISSLEYTGEWVLKDVKAYCVDVLPRFSSRLDSDDLGEVLRYGQSSPQVVLLTRKKGTPAIWCALSGLFYNRVFFYDTQVDATSAALSKQFGVQALPAIVGIMANGESLILTSGSSLEQADLSIDELKILIEDFEKKSILAGPYKATEIPLLSKKNFHKVCRESNPVCFIAAFKSTSAMNKAKQILYTVLQKTLVRTQRIVLTKDGISLSLLDATKQLPFLHAFGKSNISSKDCVLIAYKPRTGKYAFLDGPFNLESVESFIIGILTGDVQLKKIQEIPTLV